MENAAPERRHLAPLVLLGLAGVALAASYLFPPDGPRARALLSNGWLVGIYLLAGLLMLREARRPRSWRGALPLGLGTLIAAVPRAWFLVRDARSEGPLLEGGPGPVDVAFLVIGALLVFPFLSELRDHFEEKDRREVAADVGLIAAAAGGVVYLMLRPGSAEGMSFAAVLSTAVFVGGIVTSVAAWGALALWVPTPMHLGVFCTMGLAAGATIPFAYDWVRGTYLPAQAGIDLPLGFAALALAALVTSERSLTEGGPMVARTRWGRPILTAFSVAAACGSLGFVTTVEGTHRAEAVEGSVILALLAGGIVVRILMNQLRSTRAQEEARRALAEKDAALAQTEATLVKLRKAHETLAASEERLRLLFDAAVDGIVELDHLDAVRRVNEAFCTMVGLRPRDILGRAWPDLAQSVEGADPTLVTLPQTGQAVLARDGHGLHLEARTSDLPGPDTGRLLLIRDVTSAKVADQTIRSLFKFLQDRDDDRTRLLRRTNVAIEQERNRIARDLHDGPVQGVSAASLSLEAVLLILRGRDIDRGIDVLTKVRRELSEETDNLRRLMADLRPPVLEERGLVPALREMLAKFGQEAGVRTGFRSRSLVEVPADLETLAYRIVQEALSNAGKHAGAGEVEVAVEAVAGQLRIEVTDDGTGFDPNRVRDFLRMGRVGLASMRERTELANGTFMIRSSAGSGTTVVATLPLDLVPAPGEPALT